MNGILMIKLLETKYFPAPKAIVLLFIILTILALYGCSKQNDEIILDQWVKLETSNDPGFLRQGHSGIAYDTKRNKIYFFGSDTHNENWDNTVHELDLNTLTWDTHYSEANKKTYRLDENGYAISGDESIQPWAMHTYDNITYNPQLDAIVISASPEHNPIRKKFSQKINHPTWIYNVAERKWVFLSGERPHFFAGASAFNPLNNRVIVVNKKSTWELDMTKKAWIRLETGPKLELHFNMEYDSTNQVFAIFGDYRGSNHVWIYDPLKTPEQQWIKKAPGGDYCPESGSIPVAFDSDNGVFLLHPGFKESGKKKYSRPEISKTCIYNVKTNRYTLLPNANLPHFGMNYMMVYDKPHARFILIGQDNWKPVVYSLRLNPFSIN